MLTIFKDSDQVLVIPEVRNRIGEPQNNAVVVVTLQDPNGGALPGEWPLVAENVSQDGDYELVIPNTLDLPLDLPGRRTVANIPITLADGTKTRLVDQVRVVPRS